MWSINQFNTSFVILHYKNRFIILLFWINYRVLLNNYVITYLQLSLKNIENY